MPAAIRKAPTTEPGMIYLLRSKTTGWYKIGYTRNTIQTRVDQINQEVPGLEWESVGYAWVDDPPAIEKAWHILLAGKRITPGKEWFLLDEHDYYAMATICTAQLRAQNRVWDLEEELTQYWYRYEKKFEWKECENCGTEFCEDVTSPSDHYCLHCLHLPEKALSE